MNWARFVCGKGVILTANYQTVEVTCRLVPIKVLKFSVSLKNMLPCTRKPKPQKFVLPEICIHLSAVISLADGLRGCCDVGGGGRASLVHLVLTLTARWKKKPPSAFLPRPWGWENEWAQDSGVLTVTSTSKADFDLWPSVFLRRSNASGPKRFFRFVFFPPVCRIFF